MNDILFSPAQVPSTNKVHDPAHHKNKFTLHSKIWIHLSDPHWTSVGSFRQEMLGNAANKCSQRGNSSKMLGNYFGKVHAKATAKLVRVFHAVIQEMGGYFAESKFWA